MDFSVFAFLAVGAVALFTFLAVTTYAEQRTKERESYHKHETLKKLADQSGEGARQVLQLMYEEERLRHRRRLEGLKLGGLVCLGAGGGLMVFFHQLERDMTYIGVIPLLVGAALLIYALAFAPKPESLVPPSAGPSSRRGED